MNIINLTQHDATMDQLDAGVINVPDEYRKTLTKLLTFERFPFMDEIRDRAYLLAQMADAIIKELELPKARTKIMIGGAPYLMPALEYEMRRWLLKPVYAFSKRESVDVKSGNEIRKVTVFRHLGFVETY